MPTRTETQTRIREFAPRWMGVFCAVLTLWIVVLCGCQTGGTTASPGIDPGALQQAPQKLAAGDVVRLAFPGAPEMDQSQRIRPDGKISLPIVGEVDAAGKRFKDFQAELGRRYAAELKNQEVVVTLESSAASVYVSGAVNRPGRLALDRPMTVLEAVMESGGFIVGRANPKRVVVVRIEKGQHKTHLVNLGPALAGRGASAFYVKAFDVIYVHERMF